MKIFRNKSFSETTVGKSGLIVDIELSQHNSTHSSWEQPPTPDPSLTFMATYEVFGMQPYFDRIGLIMKGNLTFYPTAKLLRHFRAT